MYSTSLSPILAVDPVRIGAESSRSVLLAMVFDTGVKLLLIWLTSGGEGLLNLIFVFFSIRLLDPQCSYLEVENQSYITPCIRYKDKQRQGNPV